MRGRKITINCCGHRWQIAPSTRSFMWLFGFGVLAALVGVIVREVAPKHPRFPGGSPDSVCSLPRNFANALCPPDYQTYETTCRTAFAEIDSRGPFYQHIANALPAPADSPQVDQGVLTALNKGCELTIPPVSPQEYPDCQDSHLTVCVESAWQAFLALLAKCSGGASIAAGISAALILIVGVGAFLWDATVKLEGTFNTAIATSNSANRASYGAIPGSAGQPPLSERSM